MKTKIPMLTWVDLILLNGGVVRIECPQKWEDELHTSIDNCRARRDWWSPNQFEGCTATYTGHLLSRVDMQQVMGVM